MYHNRGLIDQKHMHPKRSGRFTHGMCMERRIQELLRSQFHLESLYPYQELVIRSILERGGLFGEEDSDSAPVRELVILPTGSGKSVCFMLPAILLEPITIVVYPLLALMNDQKRRAEQAGLKAGCLRGGQSKEERTLLFDRLARSEIKFLITNPEVLTNESVILQLQRMPIALFVIDEVHTVTQWGESFRPAYLHLKEVIRRLAPAQVVAFTATASPRIIDRIQKLLFADNPVHIVRGNPDRPNIRYRTLPTLAPLHDLEMLCTYTITRPVLIFCDSRLKCEQIAWELLLRTGDRHIRYYHAGLDRSERNATERWFFESTEGVLVSTSAYGLGVDKRDIRTVIHANLSQDVESFLQESGRAGRDGKRATSIVLIGSNELQKASRVDATHPFRRLFNAVAQTQRCKRQALLELLKFPEEGCSGCDVCDGTTFGTADGENQILRLILTYPFRFNVSTAAHLLCGSRFGHLCSPIQRSNPFFAVLKRWRVEDIERAIMCLVAFKRVRMCRVPGFRGRVFVQKKNGEVQLE